MRNNGPRLLHKSTHRRVFILKAQCREFLHNSVAMFHWDTSSLSVIVAFGRQLPTRSNTIGKPISDVVSPIDEFRLLLTAANSSFVFRLTICKVHSGYSANSQIIPHFNKMTPWWSKKPAGGTKESNGAWMPFAEGEICTSLCFPPPTCWTGKSFDIPQRRAVVKGHHPI